MDQLNFLIDYFKDFLSHSSLIIQLTLELPKIRGADDMHSLKSLSNFQLSKT